MVIDKSIHIVTFQIYLLRACKCLPIFVPPVVVVVVSIDRSPSSFWLGRPVLIDEPSHEQQHSEWALSHT
jgi:hypothetical protein